MLNNKSIIWTFPLWAWCACVQSYSEVHSSFEHSSLIRSICALVALRRNSTNIHEKTHKGMSTALTTTVKWNLFSVWCKQQSDIRALFHLEPGKWECANSARGDCVRVSVWSMCSEQTGNMIPSVRRRSVHIMRRVHEQIHRAHTLTHSHTRWVRGMCVWISSHKTGLFQRNLTPHSSCVVWMIHKTDYSKPGNTLS